MTAHVDIRCQECHANAFAYDSQRAHRTCTRCGIVDRRFVNGRPAPTKNIKYDTPVASRSHPQDRWVARTKRSVDRMVDPRLARDSRRLASLSRYAFLLDLHEDVASHADSMFRNNREAMDSLRPRARAEVAALVIAARDRGAHIRVAAAEAWTGVSGVDAAIRLICVTLGINQRVNVLDGVPAMLQALGLEYAETERVRSLYKVVAANHPSVGEDTRLALCLCRIMREYVDCDTEIIDRVAQTTWTSRGNLSSYIRDSPGVPARCVLFR